MLTIATNIQVRVGSRTKRHGSGSFPKSTSMYLRIRVKRLPHGQQQITEFESCTKHFPRHFRAKLRLREREREGSDFSATPVQRVTADEQEDYLTHHKKKCNNPETASESAAVG